MEEALGFIYKNLCSLRVAVAPVAEHAGSDGRNAERFAESRYRLLVLLTNYPLFFFFQGKDRPLIVLLKRRQSFGGLYFAMRASAIFIPSTAALVIPPAYPAPSPPT